MWQYPLWASGQVWTPCALRQVGTKKNKQNKQDTYITADVWGRLLRVEAGMGHLNDVFKLAGLLLNLRGQEECGRSNDLEEEEAHRQLDSWYGCQKLQLASRVCDTVLTFLWNLVKDWTM